MATKSYLTAQLTSQTDAWSSPGLRRCPTIDRAPGISGMPLILGMSVEVDNCMSVGFHESPLPQTDVVLTA